MDASWVEIPGIVLSDALEPKGPKGRGQTWQQQSLPNVQNVIDSSRGNHEALTPAIPTWRRLADRRDRRDSNRLDECDDEIEDNGGLNSRFFRLRPFRPHHSFISDSFAPVYCGFPRAVNALALMPFVPQRVSTASRT